MKSYYSLIFGLFFLPVTVIVYQLFPQKKRWIVLLGASYLFFWSISQQLIVYILFSSLSIHHFGLWIESIDNEFKLKKPYLDKAVLKSERQAMMQKKRYVLLMAISLHLGLLIALKYSAFFIHNMNIAFDFFRFPLWIEVPSFLLPIGISFYSSKLRTFSFISDIFSTAYGRTDMSLWRNGITVMAREKCDLWSADIWNAAYFAGTDEKDGDC